MNGKKARFLRNLVDKIVPDAPGVDYEHVNKRDKLFPVGFNADGTQRYVTLPQYTRVLAGCKRGEYQKVKAFYKAQ